MFKCVVISAVLLLGAVAPALGADSGLWDDSKYIHVADVRPGMVGYGLTVFSGDKISRFDVEVVDVVRDMVNPKSDVVLIHCRNPYLEHLGPVEGMSGSPIYLYDLSDVQHLHPRMIGAFAYGWEWSKDPVAGVQPIEYMLKIPNVTQPAGAAEAAVGEARQATWNLADVPALPGFARNGAGLAANSIVLNDAWSGDSTRLRALATPLMAGGFSPSVIRTMSATFAPLGMSLEAGGVGGGEGKGPGIPLEPGAALVAPLLTGDVELTAIGTCTEVRGDQVFGFGHDFNNEGPIALPLASGRIATIIANLHSSFKLGEMDRVVGTLNSDQTCGVAGRVGRTPAMAPITLHVRYRDGSLDETYHFQAAIHPKFTPIVVAAAAGEAIAGVKDLPEFHTLDYDFRLDFADGRNVHVVNRGVNCGPNEIVQQIAFPILATSENAFEKVAVSRIEGTINVSAGAQMAEITAITLPKLKYEPGEKLTAIVSYRPWRGGVETRPITFELPKDLPDDDYQLIVSDWERYFSDQRQAEPFRFTAESIDELFDVLNDFEAVRHNALYVRLVRQADGVAVGRTALPRLPVAMRQALLASGRSDLTAFVSSSVKTIPTDLVMSGSADFSLTIKRQAHVEPARASIKATTQQ